MDTSLARHRQRAGTFARKLHSWALSDKVPVVVDLVSDAVHSRFITALMYAVVFLYVMRSALFVVFLWNPVGGTSAPQGILSRTVSALSAAGSASGSSSELGAPMNADIAGSYLRVDNGKPIRNATIIAQVELMDAATNLWADRYGLQDTIFDYTGVPIQGVYGAPGLPPRIFAEPQLSGNVTHTSFSGAYSFRLLRLQLAVPGIYGIKLVANDTGAVTDGGRVNFVTSVADIELLSAPVSRETTSVPLGQPLPIPFVVRVRDEKGAPLAGKRVALVSAPPNLLESSSFLARPDMFLTRFAVLQNAVSTVTDYAGRAAFQNVTVVASTLSTVRLYFVCDGVSDPDAWVEFSVTAPSPAGYAPAPAPVVTPQRPGSFADLRRVVLQIQRQPSTSVTEGSVLQQQPIVRVMHNVSAASGPGWQLVPLPGVQLIALPCTAAGLKTRTLTSPAGARELGVMAGTPLAVLSNLAQTKALTGFLSTPADASGAVTWSKLGFTRHGPAGEYTLTFGLAGVHLETETAPIMVASSVAVVLPVQPDTLNVTVNASALAPSSPAQAAAIETAVLNGWVPATHAYNVTICNYPACAYYIGGAYGSPIYADGLAGQAVNATVPSGLTALAPQGPSGFFAQPPTLRVTDAQGRILSGKVVEPRVYRLMAAPGGGVQRRRATDVVVKEFPYAGASSTVLSSQDIPSRAADDGTVSFLPHNIAFGDAEALAYAVATGRPGSFFRVLAAPAGTTSNLVIVFAVEGQESAPIPLIVNNLDAVNGTTATGKPTTGRCAYLEVVSTPSVIHQTGESILLKTSRFEGPPLAAQAFDSFGNPVAPSAPVQQHIVSLLGIGTVTSKDSLVSQSPASALLTYIERSGGGAAFAMGNYSALVSQQLLLSPLYENYTDTNGTFVSTYSGIQTLQHTYARYVFAATVPSTPQDVDTGGWFPLDSCYSVYTDPIPATSDAVAVEWLNPPASSDNITCVADGMTPVNPLPQPVAYRADGSIIQGWESLGILVSRFDESLTTYPSHQGIIAREFSSFATLQDRLGFPAVRLAGDPSASVLLPPDGDHVLLGTVNPLLNLPFASLAQTLWPQYNASEPFQPMGPSQTTAFSTLNTTILPGATLATLPPVATRPGAPGVYRFVAYMQGVPSETWTPVRCTDNITAVAFKDYAPGAALAAAITANLTAFSYNTNCPADIGIYALSKLPNGETNATMVASVPATGGCPNACSGNGFCVCGVCVCKAPFDGSPDCSQPFMGDNWGTTFTADPTYKLMYGGLPVIDARALLETATADGYLYDAFPRFLFAKTVTVGSYSNTSALVSFLKGLLGPAAGGTVAAGVLGSSLRLADILQEAVTAGSVPGMDLLPVPTQGQHVFPVLINCDGTPVQGVDFLPLTPALDRCTAAGYPLPSIAGFEVGNVPVLPPGFSSWDSYMPFWLTANATDPFAGLAGLTPYADRRLLPVNLPSGCYRFKYTYGFNASGSFTHHTVPLQSQVASGQAVSLGASRPFRVLSPVVSISVQQWPSLYVPFDTPLPVPPVVSVLVRTRPGQEQVPFVDDCQVRLQAALNTADSPALSRCPRTPFAGFHVYVSAVSYVSGEEHPLYQVSQTNDCARAGNMSVISIPAAGGAGAPVVYQQYTANFSGLAIPSVIMRPNTGPGSARSGDTKQLTLKPGAYYLKFSAFGTSTLSPFTITVVDSADAVAFDLPPAIAAAAGLGLPPNVAALAAPGIPVTIGSPLSFPLRVRAAIDSMRGIVPPSGAPSNVTQYIPAPGTLVTLTVVDAPVDSGHELQTGTAFEVTDADGSAVFSNFAFTQGRSGRYVVLLSSPGVACNRSSHALVLNVTNPITDISVSINGQGVTPTSGVTGSTFSNPVVIDIAEPESVNLRVCVRNASGPGGALLPAPAGITLVLATWADNKEIGVPGGQNTAEQPTPDWLKDGNSTVCRAFYTLPTTPSSSVRTQQTDTAVITGADGCATLPSFVISGLSSSTSVAVVFQTGGVLSPPVHFAVLTPSDAHPFKFSDLQGKIPIPFGLAIGPLIINEVFFGPNMRLIAAVTGIVTTALFWALGTQSFITQLSFIQEFYTFEDSAFITALQVAYIIGLIIITAAVGTGVIHSAYKWVKYWLLRRAAAASLRPDQGSGGDSSKGGAPRGCRCLRRRPPPLNEVEQAAKPIDVGTKLLPMPFKQAAFDAKEGGTIASSHAFVRHEAFTRYVAAVRPRTCAALLRPGEQQLSPLFLEALTHVFQRYADTTFAPESCIAVPPRPEDKPLHGSAWWGPESRLPGSNAARKAQEATEEAAAGAAQRAAGPGVVETIAPTFGLPTDPSTRSLDPSRQACMSLRSSGQLVLDFKWEPEPAHLARERAAREGRWGILGVLALRAARAATAAWRLVSCRNARYHRATDAAGRVGLMRLPATLTGVAAMRAHFIRVHTGFKTAACRDAADETTASAFNAVMNHRLATGGKMQVLADLRRLFTSAAAGPGANRTLRGPGPAGARFSAFGARSSIRGESSLLEAPAMAGSMLPEALAAAGLTPARLQHLLTKGQSALFDDTRRAGAQHAFSALGSRVLGVAHQALVGSLLPAALASDSTLRCAPPFIAVLDPPLARMFHRLFVAREPAQPLQLFDFVAAYHERILCCCSVEGSLDGVTPLLDDGTVWAELHAWGFEHSLRHRVLEPRAVAAAPVIVTAAPLSSVTLTPAVYRVLATAFAHTSSSAGAPSAMLTWEQLTAFRATLSLPPVRRDYFSLVCKQGLDSIVVGEGQAHPAAVAAAGPPPVFLKSPLSATGRDAAEDTRERLGPVGYANLAVALYGEAGAEKHLRQLLRSLGYSDRLLWAGKAVSKHKDRFSGVSPDLFVDARPSLAYAKSLVAACSAPSSFSKAFWASACSRGATSRPAAAHPLRSVAPDAVAAAKRRLESPVFIPQRMWISFALSLTFMFIMTLITTSLTYELRRFCVRGAIKIVDLEHEAFATMNDAVANTAAIGNMYMQKVLNDAAGLALAAPAAFTTGALTSASIDGFITGKITNIVENDIIGTAVGGTVVSGVAANAITAGGVALQSYINVALSAVSGIAGELPTQLDGLVTDGEDFVQQKIGVQLSGMNFNNFVQTTGLSLIERLVPSAGRVINDIAGYIGPSFLFDVTDQIDFYVGIGNMAGNTACWLMITSAWLLMLAAYRRKALRTRVGAYPFNYKSVNIGAASRFVGVQASLVGISFIVAYVILFVTVGVLIIPGVITWLWNKVITILLGLLGVTMLLRVLELVLVNYILSYKQTILYRRLYMLADLWLSFISIATGFIIALIRMIPLLPMAVLAMSRSDMSPLPLAYERWDSIKSVYNSVLLQDSQYSHPVKYAFALAMIEVMNKRRAQRAGAAFVEAAARTTGSGGGGGGGGSEAGVQLKMVKVAGVGAGAATAASVVRNPLSALSAAASAAPEDAAAPEAPQAAAPVQVLTPQVTDPYAAAVRRRRARNRWHLAVLLHFNPSLREYRVRELPLTELAPPSAPPPVRHAPGRVVDVDAGPDATLSVDAPLLITAAASVAAPGITAL